MVKRKSPSIQIWIYLCDAFVLEIVVCLFLYVCMCCYRKMFSSGVLDVEIRGNFKYVSKLKLELKLFTSSKINIRSLVTHFVWRCIYKDFFNLSL